MQLISILRGQKTKQALNSKESTIWLFGILDPRILGSINMVIWNIRGASRKDSICYIFYICRNN